MSPSSALGRVSAVVKAASHSASRSSSVPYSGVLPRKPSVSSGGGRSLSSRRDAGTIILHGGGVRSGSVVAHPLSKVAMHGNASVEVRSGLDRCTGVLRFTGDAVDFDIANFDAG